MTLALVLRGRGQPAKGAGVERFPSGRWQPSHHPCASLSSQSPFLTAQSAPSLGQLSLIIFSAPPQLAQLHHGSAGKRAGGSPAAAGDRGHLLWRKCVYLQGCTLVPKGRRYEPGRGIRWQISGSVALWALCLLLLTDSSLGRPSVARRRRARVPGPFAVT